MKVSLRAARRSGTSARAISGVCWWARTLVGADVAVDLERTSTPRRVCRPAPVTPLLRVDDDPGRLDEPLADERREREERRGRVAAGVGDDGAVAAGGAEELGQPVVGPLEPRGRGCSKPYQRGYAAGLEPEGARRGRRPACRASANGGREAHRDVGRGREEDGVAARRLLERRRRSATKRSVGVQAAIPRCAATLSPASLSLVANASVERGVRRDEPRRDGARVAGRADDADPQLGHLRDAIYRNVAPSAAVEPRRRAWSDALRRALAVELLAQLPAGRRAARCRRRTSAAARARAAGGWGAAGRGLAVAAAGGGDAGVGRRRRRPEQARARAVGAAGRHGPPEPGARRRARRPAPGATSASSARRRRGQRASRSWRGAFTTRSPRTSSPLRASGIGPCTSGAMLRVVKRSFVLAASLAIACVASPRSRSGAVATPLPPLPGQDAPARRAPRGAPALPTPQQLYEHVRRGRRRHRAQRRARRPSAPCSAATAGS